MITVWGRTNSVNVQKVLWALAELGLDFRRVDAGMQFGVVGTDAYRALNPNALVPTLDDDGLVLWESNAIVRYLAARYGAGTLSPADPGERALLDRWMDWQATALYPAMMPAFLGLVRRAPQVGPEAIEASRAKTEAWLAILDAHLAGRDFVGGSAFTMGDIPVGATCWRWSAMPVAREPRPNIGRWLERLGERPAYRAHVAQPLS